VSDCRTGCGDEQREAAATPGLAAWLAPHARFDELLEKHRIALMQLDLPVAQRALEAFAAALREHIEQEELLILPRYAQLEAPPGGALALFTGEHQKLLEFVRRFERALRTLAAEGPAHRKVLPLLDQQATFKNLLEHHDARERNLLYPTLEQQLAPEELQALVDALR
jgi:hemerythrin-like domain-containing protein